MSGNKNSGGHARIKKGQVLNPGGRPKLPPELVEAARMRTEKCLYLLDYWASQTVHPGAAIMAIRTLLERAWGSPRQQIDVSGQITVTHEQITRQAGEILKGNGVTLENFGNGNADDECLLILPPTS